MAVRVVITLTIVLVPLFISGCRHVPGNVKNEKISRPADTGQGTAIMKEKPDSSAVSDDMLPQIKNKILGRWLRTDGYYTLEFSHVSVDGIVDAGYFNPAAVNVERAVWKMEENRFFVTVVLRDVNYPGSTYTLEYRQEDDSFAGNYYQAVEGINYDVVFIREK